MDERIIQFIKWFLSIIALILATVLFSYYITQTKIASNDLMAQAALRKISNSLEKYKSEHGHYPTSVKKLTVDSPPYFMEYFFEGVYSGYQFSHELSEDYYRITATPKDESSGTAAYAVTTTGRIFKQINR